MDNNFINIEINNKCIICFEETTPFGTKQTKHGPICRVCAHKFSEFFTDEDFSRASFKKINNHLRYRNDNESEIKNFTYDMKVDGKYTLYIDSKNKRIVVSKKNDLVYNNSDIIPAEYIKSVSIIEKPYQDDSNLIDVIFEIKLVGFVINKVSFRVNEFPGIERGSETNFDAQKKAHKYLNALVASQIFKYSTLTVTRR